MATTQPIREKKNVRELAEYYRRRGKLRNYALILLGVHTALRISDLLRLRWEDVYDFDTGNIKASITITEKKTKKTKSFPLNRAVVGALTIMAGKKAAKGRYILENSKTGKAISRVQAYRLIRAAAEALDFSIRVSCHSLRKTFGYHAWKSGVDHVILMEIYNHSSFAVTKRYLGITADDTDAVYLDMALIIGEN